MDDLDYRYTMADPRYPSPAFLEPILSQQLLETAGILPKQPTIQGRPIPKLL